jgi:altronate dehydratase small subunit
MNERKAILLHEEDDVATALRDLPRGAEVYVERSAGGVAVVLRDDVRLGHKFALRALEPGEEIRKYGLPIGRALEAIQAGQWVHVHNCRSDRFGHRHQQYGVHA